ncbi:Uncharacterised protein [Mycobacteroides abscessus subsp. abscessus]|nr:Uncharacterised protein [Mycobacteroides abscessus subsp. abscessus]
MRIWAPVSPRMSMMCAVASIGLTGLAIPTACAPSKAG